MSTINNLIDQKFDRLLVIARGENDKHGKARWICHCDCGKETLVNGSSLTRGLTKSCGCYKTEQAHLNNGTFKDETGNKYGMLSVIERDLSYDPNGRARWFCQCDCGSIVSITGKHLRGGTRSCGCMKKSIGEQEVEKLLLNNSINYCSQYKVDYNLTTYYYDFGIIIDNTFSYLIEYDGSQHFEFKSGHTWNNKENFILTQQRDKMKNQYCKENNIPLIRIPYTHLKDLTVEDLKLESTPFLIKYDE